MFQVNHKGEGIDDADTIEIDRYIAREPAARPIRQGRNPGRVVRR
jgi:hypothetical protein